MYRSSTFYQPCLINYVILCSIDGKLYMHWHVVKKFRSYYLSYNIYYPVPILSKVKWARHDPHYVLLITLESYCFRIIFIDVDLAVVFTLFRHFMWLLYMCGIAFVLCQTYQYICIINRINKCTYCYDAAYELSTVKSASRQTIIQKVTIICDYTIALWMATIMFGSTTKHCSLAIVYFYVEACYILGEWKRWTHTTPLSIMLPTLLVLLSCFIAQ